MRGNLQFAGFVSVVDFHEHHLSTLRDPLVIWKLSERMLFFSACFCGFIPQYTDVQRRRDSKTGKVGKVLRLSIDYKTTHACAKLAISYYVRTSVG